MSAHPIIGITGPDRGGLAAWWFTAWAVRRAGGRPRRIRPQRPRFDLALDGLVIGGGADVSPQLYGQRPREPLGRPDDHGARTARRLLGLIVLPALFIVRRLLTTKRSGFSPERDRLEKALIVHALNAGLPLLGICRGMQLINITAGGSLHQSIEGFYQETPALRTVLPRKRVMLVPGSRLATIIGRDDVWVNALHRQAIDRVGNGLRVCGRETNGIAQAIEGNGGHWIIGVQWHPEYLPQRRNQMALFQALVLAARSTPR